MARVITVSQLRERNIQLVSELNPFYQIYHQYIICNLTSLQITGYMTQVISQPLIYEVFDKHWFIFNHLLLFYLLYDYENYAILHPTDTVALQKVRYPNPVILTAFDELINVIRHHRKNLPLKTLFQKIKPLLRPRECQSVCQKNIFTSKAYCELIGISVSNFKLAN